MIFILESLKNMGLMKQIHIRLSIVLLLLLSVFLYSCSADTSSTKNDTKCNSSCEYWEYCNLESNKCELNTNSEFCNSNDDCIDNKICNTDNHICEVKASNCENGCYEWEVCIDDICQLKENSCYWDADCNESEFCDLETHKCLDISDSCDLDCESWETCNINDMGQQECIVNSDFKWQKLDLANDNEAIKMPYGINAFAFDPQNNTMLNYLSFKQGLNPNLQAIIGKLDLNTGIEEELSLFNENDIDVESFLCTEGYQNCEFTTYDEDNNYFISVSISSSVVIFFNYYNILKKSFLFGNTPEFSKNISTTFSQDNKNLFVYNNKNERENNNGALYQFSIEETQWKLLIENLPNVTNNCLLETDGTIYSFGGILSYNDNKIKNHISKYYELSIDDGDFKSFDMPSEFNERANISCTYDNKRDLIFLYGGSKIVNEYNELDNKYYNDLWSFNPSTKEWKKILELKDLGGFLPPDESGNRVFNGDINYPNFGKNNSRMIYDKVKDRLILSGEIPPSKGIQLYTINLSK